MPCALIRIGVYAVKLLLCKRRHRRVLHHIAVIISFNDRFAAYCVLIAVLNEKCIGKRLFVAFQRVVIRRFFVGIMYVLYVLCEIAGAGYIMYFAYRDALVKQKGNAPCDIFAHAV